MSTSIRLAPIAGALGAEVHGVDLSAELDASVVSQLRAALLEHLVLFFRDQAITPAQHLRFVRYFGTPERYPMVQGLEDFPEITEVLKLEDERVNFGGLWHADTTYLEAPPMGAVLVARELPPVGGDTLWSNQYLAFESLSPGLRRLLDGLQAVYSSKKADVTRTREDRVRGGGSAAAREGLSSVHPAVRTHPETGRRSLFLNYGHTLRFDGWTEQESRNLLDHVFALQNRPEFTCRFDWRPGSVAFWDNRCTQHNPVNDYHGHRRLMHRVVLAGDRPR
jgi:taurine dioxygenase